MRNRERKESITVEAEKKKKILLIYFILSVYTVKKKRDNNADEVSISIILVLRRTVLRTAKRDTSRGP